jgi:hypothetical protein
MNDTSQSRALLLDRDRVVRMLVAQVLYGRSKVAEED